VAEVYRILIVDDERNERTGIEKIGLPVSELRALLSENHMDMQCED